MKEQVNSSTNQILKLTVEAQVNESHHMEWNAQNSTTLDKIANLKCSIKSIYDKIRSYKAQASSLTNNRDHNAQTK